MNFSIIWILKPIVFTLKKLATVFVDSDFPKLPQRLTQLRTNFYSGTMLFYGPKWAKQSFNIICALHNHKIWQTPFYKSSLIVFLLIKWIFQRLDLHFKDILSFSVRQITTDFLFYKMHLFWILLCNTHIICRITLKFGMNASNYMID